MSRMSYLYSNPAEVRLGFRLRRYSTEDGVILAEEFMNADELTEQLLLDLRTGADVEISALPGRSPRLTFTRRREERKNKRCPIS